MLRRASCSTSASASFSASTRLISTCRFFNFDTGGTSFAEVFDRAAKEKSTSAPVSSYYEEQQRATRKAEQGPWGAYQPRTSNASSPSSTSSFVPYSSSSPTRFFWVDRARQMLDELRQNGMVPTDSVGSGGFHDPVGAALRRQLAIEHSCCRDIYRDPLFYSIGAAAAQSLDKFLAEAAEDEWTVHHLLRFRVQHGIALPSEIAAGLALGKVTEEDVGSSEVLELVGELSASSSLRIGSFFGTGGWSGFTSALASASGMPLNVGVNESEWLPITDYPQLSMGSEFDLTGRMEIPAPFVAAAEGSTSYVNGTSLDLAWKDGKKPRVMFLELQALDRSESVLGDVGFCYDSFVNPISSSLSVGSMFSDLTAETKRISACVPKISSFVIAMNRATIPRVALQLLRHEVESSRGSESPLLVVAMPVRSGNYDWQFISDICLPGVELAGFSMLTGWNGAARWLEDAVLRHGASAVNVGVPRCQSTLHLWERELSLEKRRQGAMMTSPSMCAKCVYTPKGRRGMFCEVSAGEMTGEVPAVDLCPLLECWDRDYLRGVEMPTRASDWIDEGSKEAEGRCWRKPAFWNDNTPFW